MTNLFFQRIQFSDITQDNHRQKPAHHGAARMIMTFIGAVLIFLAVGAAIYSRTGQGPQNEDTASQSPPKAAPLDLFP